jgi:membrane protease subunit (stomatin/prohibitin family)
MEMIAMAIASVVKWNGPPSVLAWKYPSEELSTWSSLIVNEAQEAYLFKNGAIDGPFLPGRHTLSTDNIPGLTALYRIPYGGRSPFTAEVWFVNKAVSLDLRWGTVDPIQVMDATLGVFLPVRSFGQMGLQVADPKEFLTSLVGALPGFSHKDVADYFRGTINTAIKTAIGNLLMREKMSVFQIGAALQEVADAATAAIATEFARFGLRVVNFYVHSINVPEDDPAVARVKDAMARKAEMGILGFTYQQARSFDALDIAAGNEGGLASAAIGTGVGLGAGLPLGATMAGVAAATITPMAAAMPSATAAAVGLGDRVAALRELKSLLDDGILSDEEFQQQKRLVLEGGQ